MPFTGTLAQWITSAGIVALIGILLRNQQINRKLTYDEGGNLRTHTGVELSSLREQIIKMGEHHLEREREIDDRWRLLLKESEDRHAECQRQREELGEKVAKIGEELTGAKRQFIHFQQRLVEMLPVDMRETVRNIQPFVDHLSEIETETLRSAKKTMQSATDTVHKIEDEERDK